MDIDISSRPDVFPYAEDEGVVVVPNYIQALYPLESEEMKRHYASQVERVTGALKQMELKQRFTHSISFTLILPTNLGLPMPYSAARIRPVGRKKDQTYDATVITFENMTEPLGKGEKEVKLGYCLVFCTVFSPNLKKVQVVEDASKKLYPLYERCIEYLNELITAYKITPQRHDHTIQKQTIMSQPSGIWTSVGNTKSKQIIDHQLIGYHEHVLGDILTKRIFTEVEGRNFYKAAEALPYQSPMVFRALELFMEAIDARCMGDYNEAVTKADSYVETALRYILARLLQANGQNYKDALSEVKQLTTLYSVDKNEKNNLWKRFLWRNRRKRRENIVGKIAEQLGKDMAEFEGVVGVAQWYRRSRRPRNKLTHEIYRKPFNNKDAFESLLYASSLIAEVLKLVKQKYPAAQDEVEWLSQPHIIMQNMKHADDSAKT